MAINSLEFIIFIAIVVALYFLVPKKTKWIILLIASYVFYFLSSSFLTIFLMITTLSIYLAALGMGKVDEKTKLLIANCEKEKKKIEKAKAKKKKKWIVLGTVVINIGILAVLKYTNFFTGSLNSIFKIQIPVINFLLPLGISYYTLQAISYVVDVYRGKYKPDKNLGKVALFLSFFPQIVEGPIGRYDKLANQLYEPHSFDYTNFKYGIQLIAWGFFKKMVIADRAAIYVNTVFTSYSEYAGVVVLLAVILYTLQIYAEFSGCIDIVRGISQIMGIQLEENFRRPFFSKSVQEFWRRWHITLGTWLKEYVFYPVSFSKLGMKVSEVGKKIFKGYIGKLIPAAFALFFVWFANGLWHGAAWKYIFYGLYYYGIMMLGMLLEPIGKWVIQKTKINIDTFSYHLWQILRTTGFVLIGMLIFRAPHLKTAYEMLKSIFTFTGIGTVFDGSIMNIGLQPSDFFVLGMGVIIMLIVGLIQEKGYSVREKIAKQNLPFRWLLYYGVFFAIVIFGIYGVGYDATSFIYGQF